jgi:pimeloyl-ACP methyl ester carboxylesterase
MASTNLSNGRWIGGKIIEHWRQQTVKKETTRKRGCRYWFNLALFGLIMLWIGYYVIAIYSVTVPVPKTVCCKTPADEGFDYEVVTLTSPFDVTLSGWYIPSQNGAAVILLHGYDGTRLRMLAQARILAGAGYGVLLYDMRGHGESSPVLRSYGWADVVDVDTAVTWLQSRNNIDPDRIGIYGFSLGGQVALRAAAELDGIQAVAADGAGFANNADMPPLKSVGEHIIRIGNGIVFKGVEWRTGFEPPTAVIDIIDGIAPRPLLLIAAGRAEAMEPRIAQNYYDHALEPRAIWFIPEAGHGGGPKARPDEYAEKLVSFFDDGLLSSN